MMHDENNILLRGDILMLNKSFYFSVFKYSFLYFYSIRIMNELFIIVTEYFYIVIAIFLLK